LAVSLEVLFGEEHTKAARGKRGPVPQWQHAGDELLLRLGQLSHSLDLLLAARPIQGPRDRQDLDLPEQQHGPAGADR